MDKPYGRAILLTAALGRAVYDIEVLVMVMTVLTEAADFPFLPPGDVMLQVFPVFQGPAQLP